MQRLMTYGLLGLLLMSSCVGCGLGRRFRRGAPCCAVKPAPACDSCPSCETSFSPPITHTSDYCPECEQGGIVDHGHFSESPGTIIGAPGTIIESPGAIMGAPSATTIPGTLPGPAPAPPAQ